MIMMRKITNVMVMRWMIIIMVMITHLTNAFLLTSSDDESGKKNNADNLGL